MIKTDFSGRFREFMLARSLATPYDNILAAVSGGMDSVVMAELLYRNRFRFVLAHANFGLRGKESDKDEQFVRKLATKYKTIVYVKKFDTEGYASAHGISVEMAARELRYNWFYELLGQQGLSKIATAHHRDDNAETVIMNLVRGSGLRGMQGIPVNTGNLIRPMLFTGRREIGEWAKENNLEYRTDKSNSDTTIRRNFIRHEVIPRLSTLNPSLADSLYHHSLFIQDYGKFVAAQMKELQAVLLSVSGKKIKIDLNLLKVLEHRDIVLFEILRDFGFGYDTLKLISASLEKQAGKQFCSHSHRLTRDRKYLVIEVLEEETSPGEAVVGETTALITFGNHTFSFEKVRMEGIPADLKDKNTAYLDYDRLQFPLVIRLWKEGDIFMPYGMRGRKKMSDFLADEKIPVTEKKSVPVLLSGGKIVWVAGHRTADTCKVKKETEYCLKVVMK